MNEVWRRISDAGIRVLRIPTPFQVGRVNTYLLEDDPLTLVDSGPNSGKALDELERQLDALGHRIEDLELVIITHQHIDHLGLVDIVAKRSGAEVAAIDAVIPFVENFGEDAKRDDEEAAALMRRHGISEEVVNALRQVTGSFRAWGSKANVTRPLHDGEVVELRDRRLEVQHRPGHSPSDTVFWDQDRRILLAADHLIKHISSNPLISRPLDGSGERTQALVVYLESLKKTRALPAEIVLSGHGEPITDHAALIDERFRLHQRRAEKLYRLIAERPRTGHELAQALWGDVAVTQAFLTLSEVIGHVDLLVNAGYVREVEDQEVVRYEASDTGADQLGDLIPGGNPVRTRG
jgi:glyoxylase-like metal-dependent hydrolase (beta-lactamase superfamily II)